MKLSGHNFNNSVFDSLLANISKDVELKKTAKTQEAQSVDGFFTSKTSDDLDNIKQSELEFIANELNYAAQRSKIAVTSEDLAKFATQCRKENLRGKHLERAAQKYCNQLNRSVSHPQGATHSSSEELINQLASHRVMSASHNPEHGLNDTATGKYMGCSKNPNSIWDVDALQKKASTPLGDEQIKKSKKENTEYRTAMKNQQWQELQDKHSDTNQVHKGIVNAGTTSSQEVVNQKMPTASMSVFSNDRDFNNIPGKTIGEEIASIAEKRANKRKDSEGEYREVQSPKNTKNSLDKLFG